MGIVLMQRKPEAVVKTFVRVMPSVSSQCVTLEI